MKKRILLALLMFTIGLVKIIDWFIFWEKNKEIALRNFQELKIKFISRFPDFLKPLFIKNPEPATLISIVLFTMAGIIFLKEKNIFYRVLAIMSFIFGFWNLFSLM